MIHSARPTVSPVFVNIVFAWKLFCFARLWKVRKDNTCENNDCGRPSGSIIRGVSKIWTHPFACCKEKQQFYFFRLLLSFLGTHIQWWGESQLSQVVLHKLAHHTSFMLSKEEQRRNKTKGNLQGELRGAFQTFPCFLVWDGYIDKQRQLGLFMLCLPARCVAREDIQMEM